MNKVPALISSFSLLVLLLFTPPGDAYAQSEQGLQDRQPLSPVSPIGQDPPQLIKADKKLLLGKNRRAGQGHTAQNPILPVREIELESGGRRFTIKVRVTSTATTIWIDPVVAIGYDYSVEKGPGVTAVELPQGLGDNLFDLWLYNEQSKQFVDSDVDIAGGSLYRFQNPLRKFSIRGIETSAELDPNNETAFPTGLRFEKTGKAVVTMTSVTRKI